MDAPDIDDILKPRREREIATEAEKVAAKYEADKARGEVLGNAIGRTWEPPA